MKELTLEEVLRIAGGVGNGASLLLDGGESMSERRNDPQMRVVGADGIEEFKDLGVGSVRSTV